MSADRPALLAVLMASWAVYACAQRDVVLPIVAAAICAQALRTGKGWPAGLPSPHAWRPRSAAALCVVAGALWRVVAPPPGSEATLAFLASRLVAAAVFAAVLVMLRPGARRADDPLLWALAWATVTLSATVAPTPAIAASLVLFVLVNAIVLVLPSWRGGARPWGASLGFTVAWLVAMLLLGEGILAGRDAAFGIATRAFDAAGVAARGQATHVALGGRGPGGDDTQALLELGRTSESSLYLRTQVFERYRDGVWRAESSPERRPLPPAAPAESREIFFLDRLAGALPAPATVLAATIEAEIDGHGLVHAKPPLPDVAGIRDDAGLPPPPLAGAERARLLALPESLRPLLESTAREVAGSRRTSEEQARAIEAFFTSTFRYSLEPGLPRGDEALARFLRERRDAYCVYFASASTLMLRTLGVPARMVGGYLAHEVDAGDDRRFVVRVRDAHAWTEAFVPTAAAPGGQWLRIDATPSEGLPDAREPPGGIAAAWDRISRRLRRAMATPWSWEPVRRLAPPLLLAALAAGAALLVARRWRRRQRSAPAGARAPRHALLVPRYERFEALVSRVAGRRPGSETDDELLERLEGAGQLPPTFRELARAFVARYRDERFGAPAGPSGATELDALLADMEGALPPPAR